MPAQNADPSMLQSMGVEPQGQGLNVQDMDPDPSQADMPGGQDIDQLLAVIEELMAKEQQGTLTPEEQQMLDDLLSMFQGGDNASQGDMTNMLMGSGPPATGAPAMSGPPMSGASSMTGVMQPQ